MRAFQCGDDAFGTRQGHKGIQTLLVGNRLVVDATDIFQVAVLRANTGVVQA